MQFSPLKTLSFQRHNDVENSKGIAPRETIFQSYPIVALDRKTRKTAW